MKPDICIYHGNCADGFGAAWAVHHAYGNIDFVPGVYGKAPPDVTGKHVLMVDFSYKAPVLEEMSHSAATITILDHHKTAQADLAAYACPFKCGQPLEVFAADCKLDRMKSPIRAHFDMEKSGAILAWEFCNPGVPIPELLLYIQDRDLWRFNLPDSRAIAAWVFSHPYEFGVWYDLAVFIDECKSSAVSQGEAIERKHHKDIGELLDVTMRYMIIGGHKVPVANLPYTMASDAAGQLAEGNPFAACYFDRADGARVFSLRSRSEGLDVSEIAKAYGGGGHKNAAGFQMSRGWEGDARSASATS
jgi:hypothetical protein